MNYGVELTLLSEEDVFGKNSLEVLKKYGRIAEITDLCILTGCMPICDTIYNRRNDGTTIDKLKGYWLSSAYNVGKIYVVEFSGCAGYKDMTSLNHGVRPILKSSVIFSQVSSSRIDGYNGTEEVEYGEYPQRVADSKMQDILMETYNINQLKKTGRSYTFDSLQDSIEVTEFKPTIHEEYEYQGKKYILVKSAYLIYDENKNIKFSNGVKYKNNSFFWVEVLPVKWLIDDRTKTLISKNSLLSGIRFLDPNIPYKGNFNKTEMYMFLSKYMVKDLFQSETLMQTKNIFSKERKNPYNLDFTKVSEEDIIKGAIESGVAVFLHGPSSEGKSARVKQIDPTCEIIYLRNASPESLNGKSVYNQSTGEMIDIKPSWLRKVEEKCKSEPNKLHVVFFDEITNALPSIQGIAFNIVLDREINGIWKLPDNARIVAAGNDMKDSLAANQLAEPLFNRFAHVYIKTTTESWLKWASENNIHPAIYSYIAYRNGETLRSEYDGEKPNADPRKWEMASKILYKTENPEMLRALVGEDITKEFVEFCNQQVITLEDVINDNYTEQDIQLLNTAERYATTMGLLQVDINNLDKVRSFLSELGNEFCSIFDLKWCHGDEERLELIAETKLTKTKIKVK